MEDTEVDSLPKCIYKMLWFLGKQDSSEKYDLGRGQTEKAYWVSITIEFMNKVDFIFKNVQEKW